MNDKNFALASFAALVMIMLATPSGGTSASSAPILVDTATHINRHWMTAFTNEVALHWEWPATATQAELEIEGMNASYTTNLTAATSNWVWRPFTGGMPLEEDVFDLTLTFSDSGDTVLGVMTSRLAVITAAFGSTEVLTTPDDTPWPKVKKNAVLPYDAAWTNTTDGALASQLVISKDGGQTQTNNLADASGYLGWKLTPSEWGYGTFHLTLSFAGAVGAWDGTLVRVPDGMMIRVR